MLGLEQGEKTRRIRIMMEWTKIHEDPIRRLSVHGKVVCILGTSDFKMTIFWQSFSSLLNNMNERNHFLNFLFVYLLHF